MLWRIKHNWRIYSHKSAGLNWIWTYCKLGQEIQAGGTRKTCNDNSCLVGGKVYLTYLLPCFLRCFRHYHFIPSSKQFPSIQRRIGEWYSFLEPTCAPSGRLSPAHRIHGTGIFTYIRMISMVNVGKCTNPMDPTICSFQKPSTIPGKCHFCR